MSIPVFLVVGLPAPSVGWGGEDQLSYFLVEELRSLGCSAYAANENDALIMVRHIRPDVIISLGTFLHRPLDDCIKCGIFWHFNERFAIKEIESMGWDVIVTNSRSMSSLYGFPFLNLGCSHRHAMAGDADPSVAPRCVGYVGNWHGSKDPDSIERYLVPLAKLGVLKIWGTPKWKNHPVLEKCYIKPIHPNEWPYLSQMASLWINWRTVGQKEMLSCNCRPFEYLAAGVRCISDSPPEIDIQDRLSWLNDEDWLERIVELCQKPQESLRAMRERSTWALQTNSYSNRAKALLNLALKS